MTRNDADAIELALRKGPNQPDIGWAIRQRWLSLVLGLVLVVVSLLLAGLGGCATGAPVVRVTHVEGAGSVDIETCTELDTGEVVNCLSHSVAFAEEGRALEDGELVHCTVIRRLVVAGVPFGAGLLPAPLSDARCTGLPFRPFPDPGPKLQTEPLSSDFRHLDGGAGAARAGADGPSPSAIEVVMSRTIRRAAAGTLGTQQVDTPPRA